MKKQLTALLLALALCAGLLCAPAHASSGDSTIEDGTLTQYNGPGGDVTFPQSVAEIGWHASWNCPSGGKALTGGKD